MSTWWLKLEKVRAKYIQREADDESELYFLFAICYWGNKSSASVSVKRTAQVDLVNYEGNPMLSYAASRFGATNLWGSSTSYKAINLDKSAFFVAAAEHDYTNRSDLTRNIKKEMLSSLKYSLKNGRSREDTLKYLKRNFKEGIDNTESWLVNDDEFEVRRLVMRGEDKDAILATGRPKTFKLSFVNGHVEAYFELAGRK